MAIALTCQIVADEDLIPRFVQGRLTPDAAERLEAHCFACDACWGQLQAAMALTASLETAPTREGDPVLAAAAVRRPWQTWRWLAAAATIVVAVGVGSLLLWRAEPPAAPTQPSAAPVQPARPPAPVAAPETPAPVERNTAAGPVAVAVNRQADGSVQMAWLAVAGAASYRVGIFTTDGREVFARETTGLTLVIGRRELAALPQKADLMAQVEARDVMHAVIAQSQPAKFAVHR